VGRIIIRLEKHMDKREVEEYQELLNKHILSSTLKFPSEAKLVQCLNSPL